MASASYPRNGNAPSPRPVNPPSTQPQGATLFIHSQSEQPAQPSVLGMARRVYLPSRYMHLEPALPLSAINDNPVFGVGAAATILGVSVSAMKKWLQRNQGPDYYQYGENGPVRYALNTLLAFKAAHLVTIGGKQ